MKTSIFLKLTRIIIFFVLLWLTFSLFHRIPHSSCLKRKSSYKNVTQKAKYTTKKQKEKENTIWIVIAISLNEISTFMSRKNRNSTLPWFPSHEQQQNWIITWNILWKHEQEWEKNKEKKSSMKSGFVVMWSLRIYITAKW